MNPFLRYLADKNSAHRQTDRQTDRHTPMTTRPCGLRRAGNYVEHKNTQPEMIPHRCKCIALSEVSERLIMHLRSQRLFA